MFTVALAVALSLLRPPGSRAGTSSRRATPASTKLVPSGTGAPKKRMRRLAAAHRMREAMVFRHRLVRYATHLIGVPYVYGGSSPRSGFDCSGFVRYVYSHFGVSLPHSSFADLLRGKHVSRRHLLPGDLVFFDG
ncbi:MAG: C40 family peptidase, partial [Gaiellaceae bacterium]